MGDEVDGHPPEYGITLEELRDLMQIKGADAVETISKKYGGVLEICKKLYTSTSEGKFIFYFSMIMILNIHFQKIGLSNLTNSHVFFFFSL